MYKTIVKTPQMFLFFHLYDLKYRNSASNNPKTGVYPPPLQLDTGEYRRIE